MNYKFALAGNPNCGKTTMFNALTGANQYVGNWPGVTVEKKEGKVKGKKKGDEIIVTDLPGIYSLSPYTLEEVVSRDYLLKENPDVIIDLVDATNIERNLYLSTQLIETGVPVVIALNMSDLLEKRNLKIDTERLSMIMGCPVVSTSALKQKGLKDVIEEAIKIASKSEHPYPADIFTADIEDAIEKIKNLLPSSLLDFERRWYAVKLFENDSKVISELNLTEDVLAKVRDIRGNLEKAYDDDAEAIITDGRYKYIQSLVSTVVKKGSERLTTSDKIDRIVTNRVLGIPIFVAIMFIVYYISVTTVGTWLTDWANDSFGGWLADLVTVFMERVGAGDIVTSLVVDGIIGGVVTVLGFAPQMAVLFLFLAILEDCGYMVRIAFVMDRVFRHFGLSGKSFIPLLISSGCGVPGILSSKTIENDNDRRLTIMTATFIPCGAKLPVIALMAGAMAGFMTGYHSTAWVAPMCYFIGILAVLLSAVMLKKTKPFSGKPAPFVMELPSYHIPGVKTVLLHVWERLWGFIKKAGTILFLAAVIMWFLATYGYGVLDNEEESVGFGIVADTEDSIMAKMGGAIDFVFTPLGFGQWQPVAASISGFVAKEAIVSTMGILAGLDEDVLVDEEGNILELDEYGEPIDEDVEAIAATESEVVVASVIGAWFPSALAAFCFLLFNLLDSPCLAAISVMAQQMQSRKWFWFAIAFQNIFGYVVTMIVYQVGLLLSGSAFTVTSIVALVFLAAILFALFRPDPYKDQKVYTKRSVQVAEG